MKYIVDIKGDIEGDYEIIGKYDERPHGKWTTEQGTLLIKCSVCNQGYYYHPKNHFYHNFCPNCGADMRGE